MPRHFIFLLLCLTCLCLVDIAIGSVYIPVWSVVQILFDKQAIHSASWELIVLDYRLPKTLTAVLAGAGLAVGGLQMQTLFRNPLASPDLLGISAGASLGVAVVIFLKNSLPTWAWLQGQWLLIGAATAGAVAVLLVLLWVAHHVSATSLLVMGFLFTALIGAFVNLLQYFSRPDTLQQYMIWTFGSLHSTSWQQLPYLAVVVSLGLGLAYLLQKPLNTWLLGEQYAQSMGVNSQQVKILLMLSVGLLAGGITAFCGFISFVAVAVPHLAFYWLRTANLKLLLPMTALLGAIVLLACDILCSLSPSSHILPINIVTALLGSPVVLGLLWRKG